MINSVFAFFAFLKKPTSAKENVVPIRYIDVLWISIVGYICMLILIWTISTMTTIPLTLLHLMPSQNPIKSTSLNVFFIVLFIPIVEELIFRLPLRFNPKYFLIFIALPVFFLNKHNLFQAFILCSTVIFLGAFLLYSKKCNISNYLKGLWQNHYPFVFYFFVIIFGVGHITNFVDVTLVQYLLVLLITAPQIVIGICLSYVRIKFDKGILVAILMHILLNGITCLVASVMRGGEHLF